MKKIKNILIIIAIVFAPIFLFAQDFSEGLGEELTILVSPENPEAYEVVLFEVISDSSALGGSTISWNKNGYAAKKGVGQTTFETNVGALGELTTIGVVVTKNNGEVVRKSVKIRPARVDLVWEADSYTPRFYKGKGLATHQGAIKVVALPSIVNSAGAKISSKNLNYEWALDNKVDREQSGTGKNTFVLNGKLTSNIRTVTLLVSSSDSSLSARKTIDIEFVDPLILFYKKNPLTGLASNSSIRVGNVKGVESIFMAEPYFFSRNAFEKNTLEYRWLVDGKLLEDYEKRKEVIFDANVSGKSKVSLEISNPKNILQSARSLFEVVVE